MALMSMTFDIENNQFSEREILFVPFLSMYF